MNKLKSVLLIGLLFLGLSACEKEPPVIPNQEEIITNMELELVPVGGGASTTLTFSDIDGDQGEPAVINGGTLQSTTVYNGTISLSNQSVTPSEDIGEEVLEEGDEHQFFFQSDITDLVVSYGDMDVNSLPIGLQVQVTTGAAGTGELTVTLRHEPVKDAAGVAAGDITNAGGETDIEVAFPINVQ